MNRPRTCLCSLLVALSALTSPAFGAEPDASDAPSQEPTLGSETAATSFILHGKQTGERSDGLRLSGDVYIDTGYEKNTRALESQPDSEFWLQQGRVMFQVQPTMNAGQFFFQAGAQLLAHVDEIPGSGHHIDTDDAWLKMGMWDVFDIQVGRYEAWEVYHKGQGLERDTLEDLGAPGLDREDTGPDIYEVNYAYYRQDGLGQAALHLYPTDSLRFEVSGVFGNEVGFNAVGLRPAAILDLGAVKIKAAAEWMKRQAQWADLKETGAFSEERRGFGGGVQLFLDEPGRTVPIQAGVNAAYGLVDKMNPDGEVDETGSPDTLSVGGFLNLGIASASLGLGYNHTLQNDRQRNDQTNDVGHFIHQQAFVSIKHPLFVPEASAKLVAAVARADLQPAFDNHRLNEMYSVRLRLLYRY